LALEGVLKEAAMQVDYVAEVSPVFRHLEPVAGKQVADDLAEAVFSDEEVPAGEKGNGLRSEVSPEETSHLLDWVGGDLDPVFEGAVRGLEGLFQAAAALVVEPAVIRAAKAVFFRNAKLHVHEPMQAARPDKA
jgi:hypothetical protein